MMSETEVQALERFASQIPKSMAINESMQYCDSGTSGSMSSGSTLKITASFFVTVFTTGASANL